MSRSVPTAVVLALLVVLAGCAGAGSQATGGDGDLGAQSGGAEAESTPAEEAAGAADSKGGSGAPAVQNRELIRTAEVRVEVENFDRTRRRLAEYARSTGGFVGDSSQRVRGDGNQTWTEGRLTLRIPASNYSAALDVVNQSGQVVSSEQQTRDVTDQIVDLEARLENLRAERDRLRELYRQANDTEDVLAVQRELSRVQQQIERTEAQLRQLERKVAFTTITVHIEEERPDEPDDENPAWYETSVVSAFLESIDGVIVFLRGAVVLTAYALPYLLVLGGPAVGGVFLIQRYRNGGGTGGSGGGGGDGDGGSGGGDGDGGGGVGDGTGDDSGGSDSHDTEGDPDEN
jgi:hypothetical protein